MLKWFTTNKIQTEETKEDLIRENKRLKRENFKLTESLRNLEDYRNEYVELIEELRKMKAEYQERLDDISELEKKYKKELEMLASK